MRDLLEGLRAAGEESRLRLLALCAQGELTVSELTQIVGQSQPRVSRHLKLLCDAGLLHRFREGAWVFFRLADSGNNARLAQQIVEKISDDDPIFNRDLERLQEAKSARAATASAYFRDNAERWREIRALHVPEPLVEKVFINAVADRGYRDLLDIGTGTARILEILAPYVARGVGIDLSREMLAIARNNLQRADLRHCYVRLSDMYRLPFEDASIDLISIHQVLHFADDPARVIAEAARLLRPGGRLIVADFGPHAVEYLRASHAHRRLGFSDDELATWLLSSGLVISEPTRLEGDPLTVVIWSADRPGARQIAEPQLSETAA